MPDKKFWMLVWKTTPRLDCKILLIKRRSTFCVLRNTFAETKMLPYNRDLADSQQFEEYINSIPYLFPLRYLADEAPKRISAVNRTVITSVSPGDEAYVNLRFYDGTDKAWFDNLNLPEKHRHHFIRVRFLRWKNRNRKSIIAFCQLFNQEMELTAYDVYATVVTDPNFDEDAVYVDAAFGNAYPNIFV